MPFEVPVKDNAKLGALVKAIQNDPEINQWWKCANINAVDRAGISDHGETHIRIVANAALKIMRLLLDAGVTPGVVEHHDMTNQDAEVIVVLAAALHDVGISVHRDDHERYSLWLGYPKARQLLSGIYADPELTTMVAETLHAIIAHDASERAYTIEAGCLKLADASDMSEGRSRIPFQSGQVNIHSVSAKAINRVRIEKGEHRPIRITVDMGNSAGVFQVDDLLRHKLQKNPIASQVEIKARIDGETERRVIEEYTFEMD
ncbi:MAG: HD domain-containing protein [Verrucomicrobia bacterium]|nr:HD domain-containing protein [Kiritimatiellia bacterium]MCB1100774.1 HD domain-containing protein [Kiritimatiellia bacterium]MCP5487755.1 HD domain-containing protein [Verrucomicrobiota bacterium]